MKNILFKKSLFLIFLIILFMGLYVQELIIVGQVINFDGELLIGVMVQVLGIFSGIIMDVDGNYQIIIIGEGFSLIFSYMGY